MSNEDKIMLRTLLAASLVGVAATTASAQSVPTMEEIDALPYNKAWTYAVAAQKYCFVPRGYADSSEQSFTRADVYLRCRQAKQSIRQSKMFLKSKQRREFQLQSELDRYAAEIEELIEIADANENRAFAECYRSEWNYWRRLKQGLLELRSKYMDHARGGSDYWLRVVRVQLEGFRRVGPYGRWISRDDDGQPRTNPHNVKGDLVRGLTIGMCRTQIRNPAQSVLSRSVFKSRFVRMGDGQSFETREAAEAFAKGITDTKTRIKEGTA